MTRIANDRRFFLRRLGAVAVGIAAAAVAGTASVAAPREPRRGLTVTDLARERGATLPTGGVYDHAAQKRQGPEIDVAQATNTGGGEDNCCGSTTFWDGEKS